MFDHIPRTGGTYFARVLAQLVGATSDNFDCGPDYPDLHADDIRRLDHFQVVVGHLRLDTVKAFHHIRPRHLISLVRDPVEQIASSYKFWRYNVQEDVPHCNIAKQLAFSEFIREPQVRMATDNPMTRHFFGLWSLDHLDSSTTTEIMAIRMADSYAFIGVTDRMVESVDAFRRLFVTRQVQHTFTEEDRNASKGRVEISLADREFLQERNALDYAVYRHVNDTLDQILATPSVEESVRIGEHLGRWSWK